MHLEELLQRDVREELLLDPPEAGGDLLWAVLEEDLPALILERENAQGRRVHCVKDLHLRLCETKLERVLGDRQLATLVGLGRQRGEEPEEQE